MTGRGRLDAMLRGLATRGNEGLMVKMPASIYSPGKRGKAWLKVKRPSPRWMWW